MIYYALKNKTGFSFRCFAASKQRLEEKIVAAFYDWRGLQPKNSINTMEDFMSQYVKVKITVEEIK